MSLLRFGGKDPQGNAKGVNVDDNGYLRTIRQGENSLNIPLDISVPSGATVPTDVVDIGFQDFKFAISTTHTSSMSVSVIAEFISGDDVIGTEDISLTETLMPNGNRSYTGFINEAQSSKIRLQISHDHGSNRNFSFLTVIKSSGKASLFNEKSIAAGVTEESENKEVSFSDAILYAERSGLSGDVEITINYLNDFGDVIHTELLGYIFESEGPLLKNIKLAYPKFRVSVKNHHTSSRNVTSFISEYTPSKSINQAVGDWVEVDNGIFNLKPGDYDEVLLMMDGVDGMSLALDLNHNESGQLYTWFSGNGDLASITLPSGEDKAVVGPIRAWPKLSRGVINTIITKWTYKEGSRLRALAVDSNNNAIIGGNSGFLRKISPEGDQVWGNISLNELIMAMQLDSDDNIYVITNDSKLRKFNPSGTQLWSKEIGGLSTNYGFFVKNDSTIYVVIGNNLARLDGEGDVVWQSNERAGAIHVKEDDIYVSHREYDAVPPRVKKLSDTGTDVNLVWSHDFPAGVNPDGVNVGSDDMVYIATGGIASYRGVVKVNQTPEEVDKTILGTSKGHISIDKQGALYVSGGTGRVDKLDEGLDIIFQKISETSTSNIDASITDSEGFILSINRDGHLWKLHNLPINLRFKLQGVK